jgi:hypothetical protein
MSFAKSIQDMYSNENRNTFLVYGILFLILTVFSFLKYTIFMGLEVAFVLLLLYSFFFKFAIQRSFYLTIFTAVGWRVLFFLNMINNQTLHIFFPLRIIIFGIIGIPGIYLLFKNFKTLNNTFPYLKYILIYGVIYVGYFIFYNHHFFYGNETSRSYIDLSTDYLVNYFYFIICIVVTACGFLQTKDKQSTFNNYNRILMIFIGIEALFSVIGYPLNLLTMEVEGFKRSIGFLYHPNAYAKTLGVLLLYFATLYVFHFVNQKSTSLLKAPLSQKNLILITIISSLAFFLSFSKNKFLAFLCAAVYFVGYSVIFEKNIRKPFIKTVIGLVVGFSLSLFAIEFCTDGQLMSLLNERMSNTNSMDWRIDVWNFLIQNFNTNFLVGNGLTASSLSLYHYFFDNKHPDIPLAPYAHNSFLQHYYDMGLLGMLAFTSFVSVLFNSFKKQRLGEYRILHQGIITLTLFAFISFACDESFYDYNFLIVYWMIITAMYGYIYTSSNTEKNTSPTSLPRSSN